MFLFSFFPSILLNPFGHSVTIITIIEKNIGKRITLLCVCSHLKHAQPFPVEWSPSEKFSRESTNGIEIFDLKKFETVVNFLKSGCRYFFRIAFGNFQGYGRFQNCTPFSVVPSCKLIAYIFSFRMNKKTDPEVWEKQSPFSPALGPHTYT